MDSTGKQKNVIRQNILEQRGQAEFYRTGKSFKSSARFASFVKLFLVLTTIKEQLIVWTAEYSEA